MVPVDPSPGEGDFWDQSRIPGSHGVDPELPGSFCSFSIPPCPVPAPPCPDMFDKTRSGRIDVYGFSALLRFIQQWRSLFQQYDRDQSGSISFSELQQGG